MKFSLFPLFSPRYNPIKLLWKTRNIVHCFKKKCFCLFVWILQANTSHTQEITMWSNYTYAGSCSFIFFKVLDQFSTGDFPICVLLVIGCIKKALIKTLQYKRHQIRSSGLITLNKLVHKWEQRQQKSGGRKQWTHWHNNMTENTSLLNHWELRRLPIPCGTEPDDDDR